MKIAQLAPLWETVPPRKYGGTELVVYILCEEFAKRGHDVTLYACGKSDTSAKLESGVKSPILYELQTISKLLSNRDDFDIIHNHMGYQFLPFIKDLKVNVVTTLHGAFVIDEEVDFFNYYKDLAYISISNSQRKGAPDLNYISTVYNGIQIEKYTFEQKSNINQPYLAFLGRMSKEKGPHLAIQLAKETNFKLIMAGKVDFSDREYFKKIVEPLIDNEQILFIGELGHKDKVELLKNAYATVHPVGWPEPFGLVMAESMACGTPVLALNHGSIPEVIKHGITGFVENDIEALIKDVKDIQDIDRQACRNHVKNSFSAQKMADGYLTAYKNLIDQNLNAVDETAFIRKN